MLTEAAARRLLSPPGQELLKQARPLREDRADTLRALTRLRQRADPEDAAAAWEMADLQARAVSKFGAQAAQMLFTREALEQASGQNAADYHALRFQQAGVSCVHDLTGGIGGDALAFARAGLSVMLYEHDPVRALLAAHNAQACGLAHRITVVHGDAQNASLQPGDAAWLDPSRRHAGRRVSGPEDYQPPLSLLRALSERGIHTVGVKAAPALLHSVAIDYGAQAEWLSDSGECKEALLWLGRLRRPDELTRATLLTSGGPLTLAGWPDDGGATEALLSPPPIGGVDNPPPKLGGPGGPSASPATGAEGPLFLYEPDPAVIRAHLVGTLARQLDASVIDPQIAYLLAPALAVTPFARAYRIVDSFPYARKRLQRALQTHDAGRVIIKKRGFPLEPDAVRAQLTLTGARELTVVLTRRGDTHWAFLCLPEPAAPTNASTSPRA